MIYRVEAEKFKGAIISRVYFKGRPETNDSVEGEVFARRLNDSSCFDGQPSHDGCIMADDRQACVTLTVYIKVRFTHYVIRDLLFLAISTIESRVS